MKVIINLNDRVRVKLNNKGKEILKKAYIPFLPKESDEEGYYEFQLWDLIWLFNLSPSSELPFETTELEVVNDV